MLDSATRAIDWTEQGLVPDSVIRHGIRRLLKRRLAGLAIDDCEVMADLKAAHISHMDRAEVAPLPHLANEQHYGVPPEFFSTVLGKAGKYSCCYWGDGITDLNSAETAALRITCERAGLQDGMDILELGCGWGSLTLWMAWQFPLSRITAVSNSSSQRDYIMRHAERLQLSNVEVITCDMNDFDAGATFDRIVSVEMFEHMRNYRVLFERVSGWLKPDGRFFMHIFCHRDVPYIFEDRDASDWMSRYFFSGGMMPSCDLPLYFQDHLRIARHWQWSGLHYEQTANAWLSSMDQNKTVIWPILQKTYGADAAQQWWMRWRMFFMACAELFAYDGGQQWQVGHYLFDKARRT
ncbi:MAG: cyclopropane-fatty-acyl-phospholipid synthase family protein [Gammaproteobacteria bacterium]